MIDRQLLRYFLAIVDEGNFSAAARRCGVSQPTLSIGIRKLEHLVGGALFARSNRRVALTAAGTRLIEPARRVEASFAEAEAAASQIDEAPTIRLGVIPTLPGALIEKAVGAACAAGDRVEVVECRKRNVAALLQRGRIDAAVAVFNPGDPGEAFWKEGYAVALPQDHPLADRAELAAEDLSDEAMLVRRDCEALPEISHHFVSRGVRPFIAARTFSDELALRYVRAGLGITVMPACFAVEDIAMVPLAGFTRSRTIGIILDPLRPGLIEEADALKRVAKALRSPTP